MGESLPSLSIESDSERIHQSINKGPFEENEWGCMQGRWGITICTVESLYFLTLPLPCVFVDVEYD